MCNKGVECLGESLIEYDQQLHQAVYTAMDSTGSNMVNSGNDETPRLKFLCSFGGSILPRPQDGKLRYVGGETRIVSVPRDIGYEELMGKMRELYEAAAILKYQQPDEDLDALVSVVNDDDVTNMMEEYDKLGSGDGFTRLRIFLFSHPDQDASPLYMDGDERDTERRYVDALNSLNESPDYRRQQLNDSMIMNPVDEVHIADQLFNSINLEGSVHNQRNYEMSMQQYNLPQLAVPSIGLGQHSVPVAQRYNEETPWSPAYYSPRCAGPHDRRTYTEYPSPPSSARCRVPFQEIPDKCADRMPEECNHHQQAHSQISRDHQQQYSDNVSWLPTGAVPVDRGGFPGNILNGPNVLDGPSVCEHCKMTFKRNISSPDFHWMPEEQSHVEQSTMGNGFAQIANSCVGCLPNREPLMFNTDSNLQHGIYLKEQGDPRQLYNEHRAHIPGVGTMGERYPLDGSSTNVPIGLSNLPDGHLVPTAYAHHEDPRYMRAGAELGGECFHGQTGAVRTANLPYSYGADIPPQVIHSHPSAHAMWRNAPIPLHVPPVYNSSNLQPRNSVPSPVAPNGVVEGSPRLFVGADQSLSVESCERRLGVHGSVIPEYPYGHTSKLSPATPFQEVQQTFAQDPLRNPPSMLNIPPPQESLRSSELPPMVLNDNSLSSGARVYSPVQREGTCNNEVKLDERSIVTGETTQLREAKHSNIDGVHLTEQNNNAERSLAAESVNAIKSNGIKPVVLAKDGIQLEETNYPLAEKPDLSFLPELIASAKKAKLESAEAVKARAREDGNPVILCDTATRVANADEKESLDVDGNSEAGSGNENLDASKIEPTKAEEEAIAKGLQTIKNDDLEEIRVLGSGTYGAVYHGKWKGSDVAVKRIKASCFAGQPSERERLIADFWKEALILSSLHHPNVVSFYGIVRDGPDGSLATVTEFMVNGSLKQYLQKKDRTIDRRKRLIIAMDAAFGMEYLHGKNIVHFDLKCENLLVNMRDPHRPVCKIGDLGLSKVKQHTLVSGGVRGTLPWMAPELLSGKSNMVTEKIDVYSFGIVMWELLTGEEPYSDKHCASIIGGIVNNTLRPQIPTWCDPEWKSLMESCWAPDPAERPSFSEISQKLRSMAAVMNVK